MSAKKTSPRQRQANAMSVLAQLACLDIPGEALINELLLALQELVPFDRTSYRIYDHEGHLLELHTGRDVLPEVVALYLQQWMGRLEVESYAPHLRDCMSRHQYDCVRISDAIPRLRHTAYHDQILRPLRLAGEARMILRGEGAQGKVRQITVARDRQDFSIREITALRNALPYLTHAMARKVPALQTIEATHKSGSTLLLVDRAGRVQASSTGTNAFLAQAWGRALTPTWYSDLTLSWAQPYLAAIVQRVDALLTGQPSALPWVVERNRYGTFHLRGYVLQQATTGMPPLYGIQIERYVGLAQRLFNSERFRHLTASERDVALRLAQGATPADIARETGVKASTAIFHTRNIYRRLGINQRSQLVPALLE